MCPVQHCSRVFPGLPKSEWHNHRNQVCEYCGVGRRFKSDTGHLQASKRCALRSHLTYCLEIVYAGRVGSDRVLCQGLRPPSCRYWDLGIENAISKFLEDPEIRAHVKSRAHRSTHDPSSFYGSQNFQDLDTDCAGILTQENPTANTMLISLGGDGVQLLNWGARTATVIALKCEDLPPHLIQTARAVSPLIIIEGPSEPSILDHVLRKTVTFLHNHAPSTSGHSAHLLSIAHSHADDSRYRI